jgi:hypothetical protein
MRRYEFYAAEDLIYIMQDWKGTDVYSIVESFINWGENVNSKDFLYEIYNYDMMDELEDWFLDNGGNWDFWLEEVNRF